MSLLNDLHKEILSCRKCSLAPGRTRVVPGEGAENAQIMFIGEGPGWHEDQQGRPFVGAAGQFLETLLASIKLNRQQVYITNVVKCRPPQNREPMPVEITACRPWLEQQIRIIKPGMIVTLGRHSLGSFFPGESMSKVHGTARKKDGIIYFAMYHPAAALHQPILRQTLEADFLKIPGLLVQEQPIPEKKPEPQQLSLFG